MMNNIKRYFYLFALLSLIFSTALSTSVFGQDIDKYVDDIKSVISKLQDEYCPDKRLGIFIVDVEKSGKKIVLKGELSEQLFFEKIIEGLKEIKKDVGIKNEIVVFPENNLKYHYAIAKKGVVDIHRETDIKSELITQAILGQEFKLYKSEGDWFFAKLDKDYIGWVHKNDIFLCHKEDVDHWIRSVNVIIRTNFADYYDKPFIRQVKLGTFVAGNKVILVRSGAIWSRVALPCGSEVWVGTDKLEKYDPVELRKRGDAGNIIKTGIRFLGIPYLWGGKSPYGFDCSGFVKTVYMLNGIDLPRDANQQALCGTEIEFDENLSNLKTGDLLFFGRRRVTHVGIYINDGWYIHSSGYVRINNLKKERDAFIESRAASLLHIKRILD